MHVLDELDEPKAALRMLIELSLNLQGMNVTWLYKVMEETYSIGRSAVDTSYKALVKAGLVESYDAKGSRSNYKVITLTKLGNEVMQKIREIERIMVDAARII